MELHLKGKRAIVTGGSKGIGRAIAQSLAREGVHVALIARGPDALAQTVTELQSFGVNAFGFQGDLSIEADCKRSIAEAVTQLGGLDILVNNAGGSLGTRQFEHTDSSQWARVFDLNFYSAVWCSLSVVEGFKAQRSGAIVHVSSVCGRELCSSGPYTAAKAAMVAMGKEMAVSLAEHNIRVNTVAPGSVMFPGGSWEARAQRDPSRIERMLKEELPFGRFGTPEEIASVVTFLCSPMASWIAGACVPVDGGQGRAF